jgi:hypothetical protein
MVAVFAQAVRSCNCGQHRAVLCFECCFTSFQLLLLHFQQAWVPFLAACGLHIITSQELEAESWQQLPHTGVADDQG